MFRILEVKAKSHFRLWLRYSDGAQGEIDVSDLAGKGVFRKWLDPGAFETVKIGDAGELLWGDDADLCPDSLYLRLTHKRPEEVFPALRFESAHA